MKLYFTKKNTTDFDEMCTIDPSTFLQRLDKTFFPKTQAENEIVTKLKQVMHFAEKMDDNTSRNFDHVFGYKIVHMNEMMDAYHKGYMTLKSPGQGASCVNIPLSLGAAINDFNKEYYMKIQEGSNEFRNNIENLALLVWPLRRNDSNGHMPINKLLNYKFEDDKGKEIDGALYRNDTETSCFSVQVDSGYFIDNLELNHGLVLLFHHVPVITTKLYFDKYMDETFNEADYMTRGRVIQHGATYNYAQNGAMPTHPTFLAGIQTDQALRFGGGYELYITNNNDASELYTIDLCIRGQTWLWNNGATMLDEPQVVKHYIDYREARDVTNKPPTDNKRKAVEDKINRYKRNRNMRIQRIEDNQNETNNALNEILCDDDHSDQLSSPRDGGHYR